MVRHPGGIQVPPPQCQNCHINNWMMFSAGQNKPGLMVLHRLHSCALKHNRCRSGASHHEEHARACKLHMRWHKRCGPSTPAQHIWQCMGPQYGTLV